MPCASLERVPTHRVGALVRIGELRNHRGGRLARFRYHQVDVPVLLQLHFYNPGGDRQAELSELRVLVPRYGRHRRDALECGEHSLGIDVTGVEDNGDALQREHSRR